MNRELSRASEIALTRSKLLMLQERVILHKEVIGGVFGRGNYVVGSIPTFLNELHAVEFYIVRSDGLPIGRAFSFAEALRDARAFLATWSDADQRAICEFARSGSIEFAREKKAERQAEIDSWRIDRAQKPAGEKRAPKRRRLVFEKSGGRCHYCATPLTLDGKWHIEHKMPRALLGGSEQDNLVASCVPCNMKKKDKTDLEFIASRQGASA